MGGDGDHANTFAGAGGAVPGEAGEPRRVACSLAAAEWAKRLLLCALRQASFRVSQSAERWVSYSYWSGRVGADRAGTVERWLTLTSQLQYLRTRTRLTCATEVKVLVTEQATEK